MFQTPRCNFLPYSGMENVNPEEIPQSESSLSSIGIHATVEVPKVSTSNGTDQLDNHLLVMENSLRNASDDPIKAQEEHTTNSATSISSTEIDQTEKDNQGRLMEDYMTRGIQDGSDKQISQKTGSVGISHIHVEDGCALSTASNPKIEDFENGHLASPGEISSPPVDVNGVAVDQTEKDNQAILKEEYKTHDGSDEQISQKNGSVGISHMHVDGSALPTTSKPKIGDFENDHLASPAEISLPPVDVNGVGFDGTEKDNQGRLMEDSKTQGIHEVSDEQISQKTGSVSISHIHVEDRSALPTASNPTIGDFENGHLTFPSEISLTLVDVNGVAVDQTEKDNQGRLMEDSKTWGIHDVSDEQISQKTGSVGISHIHVQDGSALPTASNPKIGDFVDGRLTSPAEISLPPVDVNGVSFGETEKDSQGKLMEDSKTRGIHNGSDEQISEKTDSVGISHIHVEDGSALPTASNPKIGDFENGHLASPSEISLPPVDVNGVAFGSRNCVFDGQQSKNVHSASFESQSNHHVMPPNCSTQPHLMVATVAAGFSQDTLDGQRSQDTASVSSSQDLIGSNISSSPKVHYSKAGDAENGVRVPQMDNHSLSRLKILSSTDESTRSDGAKLWKRIDPSRIHIDTAAPFDSVKQAVSKFGEVADWKAHRKQAVERRKFVERHLDKMQQDIPEYKKQLEDVEEAKVEVLKELESTKRQIEELKLSLEKAQIEENEAKQDSELANLRVQEMQQGIANEASVAAKAQLEVAKARHAYAVSELKSVNEELETLRKEYSSLITERDIAVQKAEEAVSASKEVEKTEVKQAEEELQNLNRQIQSTKDLKLKLDTASALLVDLKTELADYIENKHKRETDGDSHDDILDAVDAAKKELEKVKLKIEKATAEVDCLKVTADSLKSELEKEKSALATLKQREGMASVVVASLEAELDKSHSEIAVVQAKKKETREKMEELPEQLQKAAQEADGAKSLAQMAREELCKAKEEADQAHAAASTMYSRLDAAQKEMQAAKCSQKFALAAIKALRQSESVRSTDNADTPAAGVILPIDDYYELSKRAHEAEEQATLRVEAFISQIEQAKQSESRSKKKLEEVKREMAQRKETLRSAMEKAEKARKGKLATEQDLRKWRAEHGKQRKASESNIGGNFPTVSVEEKQENDDSEPLLSAPDSTIESPRAQIDGNKTETEQPSSEAKAVKKKKRALFPKIFMFFSRKKSPKPSSH
ncbi:Protein WEAK CHLOROPLAST MOVEMENT UNDER BLUE LIGHT 1 [Hibiscus syriacus]|uniref:Protein WEAK CHLOROPLAST MOVEMENT UNDER BLUE LIGHT 1 n=1 Tax=Hibiscus syriacus TaxID=106335 RepID=A0A6A2Y783_HIBSY|nr:Protein WEAK CHLOROPLAST MOVEMENT UNDER BLUE LIGHT 1 [Hibiscus syriacus]